jgi:RIB43A
MKILSINLRIPPQPQDSIVTRALCGSQGIRMRGGASSWPSAPHAFCGSSIRPGCTSRQPDQVAHAARAVQALAAERAARQRAQRAAEASADAAEVAAARASAFLSEVPAAGVAALGAARLRPDHWKGMRGDQVAAVRAQQAQQAQEKAARLEVRPPLQPQSLPNPQIRRSPWR